MPVSKKRRKLVNSSAEQATKKRLLTSPLARAEADRIVLPVRVGLEAIRSGRNEETALLDMHSVVLLTEMMTADAWGALPLDMIQNAGRRLIRLLEDGKARAQWTVPADLADALTAIVNEYDRMMHQVPLQAVLAATGKLERLEKEDPHHSRSIRREPGSSC